ncbi:MAG: hypothetical protein IVW57_05170 [Ktedonobacterales bacterium]|nr:hypothetical protein [Ktedonobacterales bacterium]
MGTGCQHGARGPSGWRASLLHPHQRPVGTQVTVTINLPAGTYTLGATTTPPTSGGCATAQPIPGVAPIPVGGGGGGTTFAWPSALGPGAYWLCATLQSTGTTTASSQAFLVVAPGAPTPTSAPLPNSLATVTLNTPAAGVVAGTHITLQITGWSDRSGESLDFVELVNVDPATT